MKCPKCSHEFPPGTVIARSTVCPACSAELHACRFCKFYEPGVRYDCREETDEYISDKERANFCDRFSLTDKQTGKDAGEKKAEALAKLNALFGD